MQLVCTVQSLLPGVCWLGVQLVYMVSEPNSREMSDGGEACLYCFWTYLEGTVSQGFSQFYSFLTLLQGTVSWGAACLYGFPNLLPGIWWLGMQLVYTVSKPTLKELSAGVHHVYTVSEPICRGLSVGGAVCFNCFWTFLQETVGQVYGLFYGFIAFLKRPVHL